MSECRSLACAIIVRASVAHWQERHDISNSNKMCVAYEMDVVQDKSQQPPLACAPPAVPRNVVGTCPFGSIRAPAKVT